jgi:hypothetical protein
MATVPYQYDCATATGFVMDPNEHKRYGYVTTFSGLGMAGALAKDLQVPVVFNATAAPTFPGLGYKPGTPTSPEASASVVGVIDTFSWNGGVGDPLKIDFYVSAQNATKIKASTQQALTSTKINSLAWWIAGYDQELKQWFEQAYPQRGTVAGIVKGSVNVDVAGVKTGANTMVFKISLSVASAANMQYPLVFANSANQKVAKTWGLVVGTLATAAV